MFKCIHPLMGLRLQVECPPWVSFKGILTCIYGSFEESPKLRTAWLTSTTKNRTSRLPSTSFEPWTTPPLMGWTYNGTLVLNFHVHNNQSLSKRIEPAVLSSAERLKQSALAIRLWINNKSRNNGKHIDGVTVSLLSWNSYMSCINSSLDCVSAAQVWLHTTII